MNKMDPKKQFSKRLARYGAVVWGVYLLLTIVLMFFQPDTATACIYLVLIVTVNKAIDTLAYTDNSKTEKILLTALDKAKIEIGLKAGIGQTEEEKEDGGNG